MGVHIYIDMVLDPQEIKPSGVPKARPAFVVFVPEKKRLCHTNGLCAIGHVQTYIEINEIIMSDQWIDGDPMTADYSVFANNKMIHVCRD